MALVYEIVEVCLMGSTDTVKKVYIPPDEPRRPQLESFYTGGVFPHQPAGHTAHSLINFLNGFQNRRDCPVRLRTLKRVRCGLYDFFRFTRIPAAIRATLKKNHNKNLC